MLVIPKHKHFFISYLRSIEQILRPRKGKWISIFAGHLRLRYYLSSSSSELPQV
jgi:hypothetical protein